jgi:hypothetical protein
MGISRWANGISTMAPWPAKLESRRQFLSTSGRLTRDSRSPWDLLFVPSTESCLFLLYTTANHKRKVNEAGIYS